LNPLNEAFSYHFLSEESELSRPDKPDWSFNYIYEFLEGNIGALTQLNVFYNF
jgi:hypothetical protein